MPGQTGWLRFLFPLPGPWQAIAWAETRPDCVDGIEAWIENNRRAVGNHQIEWVVLEDREGHPQPRAP